MGINDYEVIVAEGARFVHKIVLYLCASNIGPDASETSGRGEIRTREGISPYGFRNHPVWPLRHPSNLTT